MRRLRTSGLVRVWAMGAILLLTGSALQAKISNGPEAVDRVGSERMMSMRMLKDYIMIGMGNRYGHPE